MGSNINQFLADTNKEIKKLQEKQVKEAKTIVLTAYSQILDLSPVDTSLFKHSNFIVLNKSIGAEVKPPSKRKDRVEKASSNESKQDGGKLVFSTKNLKNNDKITIYNSLVYAGEVGKNIANTIESGHSTQAPQGVYGVTEERMRKVINKRTKI